MSKDISISARVRLTIEFPVGEAWNSDVKMGQIEEQARAAAIELLHKATPSKNQLRSEIARLFDTGAAIIVGTPEVTAIIVKTK